MKDMFSVASLVSILAGTIVSIIAGDMLGILVWLIAMALGGCFICIVMVERRLDTLEQKLKLYED